MLILEYEHLISDIPKRTDKLCHDVERLKPVKQHAYRLNSMIVQYLKQEIRRLWDNYFSENSISDGSSTCIFVPKPDGTAYGKVNSVTKTDSDKFHLQTELRRFLLLYS